jgi:hypothetical protein
VKRTNPNSYRAESQSLTKDRMIFNAQDTNGLTFCHRSSPQGAILVQEGAGKHSFAHSWLLPSPRNGYVRPPEKCGC